MSYVKHHSEPLQDIWLDAYGHLNDAYYVVAFTGAIWELQAELGIGTEYFDETGGAMYTVESHVRYLNEVRAPATLDIECMILGSDEKRLHIGAVMKVDGMDRATVEFMCLHYDTKAGRVSPMPENVQVALKAAEMAELPDWSGKQVAMPKKS